MDCSSLVVFDDGSSAEKQQLLDVKLLNRSGCVKATSADGSTSDEADLVMCTSLKLAAEEHLQRLSDTVL
jgi:hypothetical protein